jgi:conjugal transfer ATP-binding protein TraC
MKILEIAKKLASALGDDEDGVTSNASYEDFKRLNKLISVDYPSFSSILPYRYFWEEKNLFINEHSIGFGLELTIFSGADEKLVNSISDLLRHRIDDEIDLQFILWGSNQVGDIIDEAFKHQVINDDIYAELAKASIQYYKKGARDGFKNKLNLPVTLREYRLFVFLSKNTSYLLFFTFQDSN